MDNAEAMYWLAVVQQANKGDKEAQEMLRQEDELRAEQGLQPIIEELKHALMHGKVVYRSPRLEEEERLKNIRFPRRIPNPDKRDK